MSFFDAFTQGMAAQLIEATGEPVRLTVSGFDPSDCPGVPKFGYEMEDSDRREFANPMLVVDVAVDNIPGGFDVDRLVSDATVELTSRVGTEARPFRVSDVRDTGQGVAQLVCEV